jgi:uncharacterized membrane-anchored protein
MRFISWLAIVLLVASSPALADKKQAGKKKEKPAEKQPVAEEPPVEEAPEPPAEPEIPHVKGPKLVDLGHQIELQLPEGMILFERKEAQDLLRKGGNDVENVLGAIVKDGDGEWSVIIEYADVGYVTDGDADELDAGQLLESYREGTRQQNLTRARMGVPELFVDGWSETPRYDRLKRHLMWGLNTHDTDGKGVNFFTRILGRGGFISLNLIDSPETLAQSKVEAAVITQNISYRAGARYEDYREGDKSSGMGLQALVVGGAGLAVAKKTGILVGLLVVFKKGFIFIAVGIAGFFKWLLGRKKSEPGPPPTT